MTETSTELTATPDQINLTVDVLDPAGTTSTPLTCRPRSSPSRPTSR